MTDLLTAGRRLGTEAPRDSAERPLVVIVGDFFYPTGSAAAARVRNLALGFAAAGASIDVISTAPQALLPGSIGIWHEQDAVRFCYAAAYPGELTPASTVPLTNRTLTSKLKWFASAYGSVPRATRLLTALGSASARGRDRVCIFYGRGAWRLGPLIRRGRNLGMCCLWDVVEIPASFRGFGGPLNPIYWDWCVGALALPRLVDGMTVITTGLAEAFRRRGCPRVLLVPVTEGWNDLPVVMPSRTDCFQLLYVGSFLPRDNPSMLLEACRILVRRQVRFRLSVIGSCDECPEGRKIAKEIANDPNLRGAIHLVGKVAGGEVPRHLRSADGLLLPRRDAPPEVNSLPTRLVEYLKSGRPLFVSDVGDVRTYLRHGVDAFLLHPTNVEAAANVLESVILSEDRGYKVGHQGRRTGAALFNREEHARRILAFAASLKG